MAHAEAEKQFPWFKWFYEFTKPYAEKTGISHEFIVAQGTQETGWGKSARLRFHNLFGITGEGPNTEKVGNKKFAKFSSFEECMDHYINMLMTYKHYTAMRNPEVRRDAKKAAQAVKKWNEDEPDYSQKIIDLIENPQKGRTFREFFARCKEGLNYKPAQDTNEAPNKVPDVPEVEPLPNIEQVWGG